MYYLCSLYVNCDQSPSARYQFHPIARPTHTSVAYCMRVRGAYTRTGRARSSSPISLCAASPLCERRRQPAGNVTLALPHRRVVHIMRRLLYAARATLLPASCRHPTTPTALLREPPRRSLLPSFVHSYHVSPSSQARSRGELRWYLWRSRDRYIAVIH